MIDLHMHTTCSDGSESLSKVLCLCEQCKLEIISITDHDTVKAYFELQDPKVRSLFSGKILPGVEISTTCDSNNIDLLGYGIDYEKIDKLIKHVTSAEKTGYRTTHLVENLKTFGINVGHIATWRDIYPELVSKHKDFLDSIDPDLATGLTTFLRRAMCNKSSPLFVDTSELCMSVDEVIKIIHDCGGLVFLAHPSQYYEHLDQILQSLKGKIDGIENFHYSTTAKQSKFFLDYCNKNKLFISGGSDFHGALRPHIEIGHGCSNIPKDLITNWLDEGKLLR